MTSNSSTTTTTPTLRGKVKNVVQDKAQDTIQQSKSKVTTSIVQHIENKYYTQFVQWYKYFIMKSYYDIIFIIVLLVMELIVCSIIIQYIQYTEIDWIAYMEEVEYWYIYGETNYYNIKGNTGPLVYPAGFIYLFTILRYYTNNGTSIIKGQYIFLIFYIINQLIVFIIYQQTITYFRQQYYIYNNNNNMSVNEITTTKTTKQVIVSPVTTIQERNQKSKNDDALELQLCHKIWLLRIGMIIVCLSKRIHSIFILRLFNDCPTMILLYLSIVCFNKNYWNSGCIIFSLAVSIKMNVLLFAPGLLLLLLQISTNYYTCILRIIIFCGIPQLILGYPFLISYPIQYIHKAFELDRVFFYIWTVNWKCISETIFLSKQLSITLLLLHIVFLIYNLCYKWNYNCYKNYNKLQQQQLQQQQEQQLNGSTTTSKEAIKTSSKKFLFLLNSNTNNNNNIVVLSPPYITTTMFISNFIGIVFARTLHYQFYSWYFHTIPYILFMSRIVYTTTTTTTTTTNPSNTNKSNNNRNNNNYKKNDDNNDDDNENENDNNNSNSIDNSYQQYYSNLTWIQLLSTIVYSLLLIVIIEISFLTFPATYTSSLLLQIVHIIIVLFHIRPFPFVVTTI